MNHRITSTILLATLLMGCSQARRGAAYREIQPAAVGVTHAIVTSPEVAAVAAPFPVITALLSLAGFLTGGATGHYAGRKLARKHFAPAAPSTPKLAA